MNFPKAVKLVARLAVLALWIGPISNGQQIPVVPRVVNFSGTLADANGKPPTAIVGVTFHLYKDEQGGPPLWMETQNVQPDKTGRYTVMLGSASSQGLPPGLFVSGEARWLGVQPQGQAEQPRVLLLSVPYALKAADAETIGGLLPSAFMLAAPSSSGTAVDSTNGNLAKSPASGQASPASNVTTSGGTVNTLPLWTTATNIQSSAITQSGKGKTAKVGINTTNPASTLDVKGGATIRGLFSLPPSGAATATAAFNSQPEDLAASVFNSITGTPIPQTFQWQAEPVHNDTSNASGSLNLLFASGTNKPAETGLNIASNGQITFATGQLFPGAVTSVGLAAPASDFTVSGSPVTSAGTLSIAWTVPPTSANTPNAMVKRDANGAFAAGGITSTSSSVGVLGQSTGTNSVSDGVDGVTGSAGASGVAGINNAGGVGVYGTGGTGGTGVFGTGFVGVYGQGPGGYGVYGTGDVDGIEGSGPTGVVGRGSSGSGIWGQFGSESVVGQNSFSFAGVFGDGGTAGGYGVLGTTDDGYAGVFDNSSQSSATLYAYNGTFGGFPFYALTQTGGYCQVDGGGNLGCSGTKNALVPIDGGKRKVALSAIESPKNWFEDAGAAELANGSAVVTLDPDFIQTVNTDLEYHVFLTPKGDCKGLYVSQQTPGSFEVHELGGGTSSIRFDYRIMALRKNYENIRFADHTNDPDPRKQMERLRSARAQARPVLQQPIHPPFGSARLASAPATAAVK